MQPKITVTSKLEAGENTVFLARTPGGIPRGFFSREEIDFITAQKANYKKEMFHFNRLSNHLFVQFLPDKTDPFLVKEACRKAGDKIRGILNDHRISNLTIWAGKDDNECAVALAEGMALGNYQFLRYKTSDKEENSLQEIRIFAPGVTKKQTDLLNAVFAGVWFTRDMVNEPNSYLSAQVFARQIEEKAKPAGIIVEVLNKKKLESMHMGGILGVNRGSAEPPVMITMEWKPAKASNKQPMVFVGKGVMFDTGGMNLKPGDYMNDMKADMAGGAAVAGLMLAIAAARLPVRAVGLIPATDNRPGTEALVSGDVIRMHNGLNVEVINTDAEGRLLLADALSYASRFKPGLVIDLATLTGSASRAIGKHAMVGMQSKARKQLDELCQAGFSVYERIVEFPLWEDYGEGLKSDVADVRNIGGTDAGAITAGKFLEKFTDYPYIHLDIAGPAFLEKREGYLGPGGTGVGVRLLFEYLLHHRS